MSYVMPEENNGPCSGCVRAVEVGCTSCVLAGFAAGYSQIKKSYRIVVLLFGTALFGMAVVAASSGALLKGILNIQVMEIVAATFMGVTCCVRARFRYLLYPYIQFEHYRIFSEIYLEWWRRRIFNRIILGSDEDDICVDSIEGMVETCTDYLLCTLVNFVVVIWFVISFLFVCSAFIIYNLSLQIWPIFLLIGWIIYPVLFIPDLLLGVVNHLRSSRGGYSLSILTVLLRSIDHYLRYTYNIQYEISQWIESREHYNKLYKIILFLFFHVALGSRAFIFLNDDVSLGYYTDKTDFQNYCTVSLTRREYNSLAFELLLTVIVYIHIFMSSGSCVLFIYWCPLSSEVLLFELYISFVWPRWTPRSVKSSVSPTSGHDEDDFSWFGEDGIHTTSSMHNNVLKQKSSVTLVDLAY